MDEACLCLCQAMRWPNNGESTQVPGKFNFSGKVLTSACCWKLVIRTNFVEDALPKKECAPCS